MPLLAWNANQRHIAVIGDCCDPVAEKPELQFASPIALTAPGKVMSQFKNLIKIREKWLQHI
jgi:hypothetical protein